MSFPRVRVKRSSICGNISDIAVLEFNVKDEVVLESFIDQNKYKSLHLKKAMNLEKVMNKIKNLKPNKSLVKRLQNEPKTTNQAKMNTSDTPLDNLINYFSDNISMEETPKPLIQKTSQSTVLQLRHLSNMNDSNVRSKTAVYLQPLKIIPTRFQVHLQPIRVQKGKTCFLIRTLPSKPLLPAKTTCESSYKAGP